MKITGNAKTSRFAVRLIVLAVCGLAVCFAFAPQAFANKVLEAPTQVSDDITRVHVNKLNADTHEYVQGASMVIIEKETGAVVDEWITGSETHANEKNLSVDRVYILREVSAPDGYEKVEDTEFVIRADEGEGLDILTGPGELTERYKINLYDKAKPIIDEVVIVKDREDNVTNNNVANSGEQTATPHTGDDAPLFLGLVLVVINLVAIGFLYIVKRRRR